MKKKMTILSLMLAAFIAFTGCYSGIEPGPETVEEEPVVEENPVFDTTDGTVDLSQLTDYGYDATEGGLVWEGTSAAYSAIFTIPFTAMEVPSDYVQASILATVYDTNGDVIDIENTFPERLVTDILDASDQPIDADTSNYDEYDTGVAGAYSNVWAAGDNATSMAIKTKTVNASKVVISEIKFYTSNQR